MKATVKFFAALREMIGARELSLEVADGQTVDGLFRELCARFPRLADYDSSLFYSVNAEYVSPDYALQGRGRGGVHPAGERRRRC